MAFDLVAEQVNDRVWFSDLFRYSGKQTHTAARLNQENPYFHVSKYNFPDLTENCPPYETGNYETNVGDHYGYSSYHQNVYWSSVAKTVNCRLSWKRMIIA